MHDQAKDTNEIHRARANGRLCGSRNDAQARNCPYSHYDFSLRQAWLNGFGEGRRQLAAAAEAAFGSKVTTARVCYGQDLKCPSCGTVGTVMLSENAAPGTLNIDFTVDLLPLGFLVAKQGRSLGSTSFVCGHCRAAAR